MQIGFLSIPFVGFVNCKANCWCYSLCPFNSLCWVPAKHLYKKDHDEYAFQFPLLGSIVMEELGLIKIISFQFPLLGSHNPQKRPIATLTALLSIPFVGFCVQKCFVLGLLLCLSIPFVGFLLYLQISVIYHVLYFQFPLLGSSKR